MADYQSANMNLESQAIGGRRRWSYEDTGPVADIQASGFVTDAKTKGMKAGDWVVYTDTTRVINYGISVQTVQDTGGTTGTLGGAVIIGDTS